MIKLESSGDFSEVTKYLQKLKKRDLMKVLNKYGEKGTAALKAATPVNTGLTASSWYYEIEIQNGIYKIEFCNSNIKDGWCNIAIILDQGHGTRNGGWVQGRHYIDSAIQPIFDELVEEAWKEVTDL